MKNRNLTIRIANIVAPVVGVLLFAAPAFAQIADDYGIAAAGTYCPTLSITMQRGARDISTNNQVSELQKFLADYYNFDPIELVTGYFGRISQGYVIQFQKEQSLPTFGIAGSLTRAAIARVCNQTPSISTNTINKNNNTTPPNTNTATTNSSAPSCVLTASSNSAAPGQPVYLSWTSSNASAADLEPTYGAVALNGSQQVVIGNTGATHPVNFTLTVSGSGKTASCYAPITAVVSGTASASIDQSSLNSFGGVITLSGSASNSSGVIVALVNSNYGGSKDWATVYSTHSYVAFTSTPPTVSNGRWSTSFNGIAQGTYTVLVYDHATAQSLLTNGMLTVAGSPTISITASSVAISPAMSMAVQYEHMPAAGVHIINSSGVTVWTQEFTSGGGGSTVVSLPSVLPIGNYTAQAFGSDGTIYATSAAYYFMPPNVNFTVAVGSPANATLTVGQSATDGGVKITLVSLASNSSGQPVANMNVSVSGNSPGFYTTAAGTAVGGGGGFSDQAVSTGGVTITVSSVSLQTNTATIIISTAQKG